MCGIRVPRLRLGIGGWMGEFVGVGKYSGWKVGFFWVSESYKYSD